MSDLERRVIRVTPDQVIGPPRRPRRRKPKADPMLAAEWFQGPQFARSRFTPSTEPTQQGFGHFDEIARRAQRGGRRS